MDVGERDQLVIAQVQKAVRVVDARTRCAGVGGKRSTHTHTHTVVEIQIGHSKSINDGKGRIKQLKTHAPPQV